MPENRLAQHADFVIAQMFPRTRNRPHVQAMILVLGQVRQFFQRVQIGKEPIMMLLGFVVRHMAFGFRHQHHGRMYQQPALRNARHAQRQGFVLYENARVAAAGTQENIPAADQHHAHAAAAQYQIEWMIGQFETGMAVHRFTDQRFDRHIGFLPFAIHRIRMMVGEEFQHHMAGIDGRYIVGIDQMEPIAGSDLRALIQANAGAEIFGVFDDADTLILTRKLLHDGEGMIRGGIVHENEFAFVVARLLEQRLGHRGKAGGLVVHGNDVTDIHVERTERLRACAVYRVEMRPPKGGWRDVRFVPIDMRWNAPCVNRMHAIPPGKRFIMVACFRWRAIAASPNLRRMIDMNTNIDVSNAPRRAGFAALRELIVRNIAVLLCITAILTALATYVVVTRHAETSLSAPPREWVWVLIGLNALFLTVLMSVVGQRGVALWRALRANAVGSRLQTRIILLFSMIAILPAIIVSAFAALFFNAGIQTWFDKRVSTALQESVAVAESYLAEHKEVLRNDVISLANGLDPVARTILTAPGQVSSWLTEEAAQRSLIEAVVIYRNRIVAQTSLSFAMLLEQLPPDVQARAENGEVVVFVSDKERVRALIKLHSIPDAYLMVGRLIDNRVIQHMENAQGGVTDYRRLQESVHKLMAMFLTLFILVALLLLTAAIWYGIVFASRLVGPISLLINAAERVRAGDYTSMVEEGPQQDELTTLARAFNRMMGDLEKQRGQLIDINRQVDARRRFTETVLLGVSAGVLAVDLEGVIRLQNRSAITLLHLEETDTVVGKRLEEVMPSVDALLSQLWTRGEGSLQQEVTHHAGDRQLTFLVRITAERLQEEQGEQASRYVITFDDITELAVAQRRAAWADVARRVAHEIKNPLTPIHLATDRLRKKYGKQITEDQETYVRYLDTISKHVADIGRMVEEFVSFARMPTPVMKEEPLHALMRKVIFSEQVAHSNIRYLTNFASEEIYFAVDERQFSRLLANLLKNAAEAIEGQGEREMPGEIQLCTQIEEDRFEIVIDDNGPGFPPDKINRLTEPYVTTREKGTGLGLAIVKKIVEDHGGKMILRQGAMGGARVVLSFSHRRDNNVTPSVANM